MLKNTASQKIAVYAYDITTGGAKTGDAANITAYVSKDYGSVTVLGDTSATEMDATNAKGMYLFDLTQAETNANCLIFTAKSSTANIQIAPQTIFTDPPLYTTLSVDANGATLLQTGTGTGQLDFTSGVVKSSTVQVNGVANAASNLSKTTSVILRGTVTTGGSTTSIPTSAFSVAGIATDQFKGRIITFDVDTTTTALRGQATDITGSTISSTPTFTVTALTTAVANGDTFSVT